VSEAVRSGRRGMPAYDTALLSDQDLAAMAAYMDTFSGTAPGFGQVQGEGGEGRDPGRLTPAATATPALP